MPAMCRNFWSSARIASWATGENSSQCEQDRFTRHLGISNREGTELLAKPWFSRCLGRAVISHLPAAAETDLPISLPPHNGSPLKATTPTGISQNPLFMKRELVNSNAYSICSYCLLPTRRHLPRSQIRFKFQAPSSKILGCQSLSHSDHIKFWGSLSQLDSLVAVSSDDSSAHLFINEAEIMDGDDTLLIYLTPSKISHLRS